jgi:hypothetical protein
MLDISLIVFLNAWPDFYLCFTYVIEAANGFDALGCCTLVDKTDEEVAVMMERVGLSCGQ